MMTSRRVFLIAKILILFCLPLIFAACREKKIERQTLSKTATVAGFRREFGEPFGVAAKDNLLYVSDGEKGAIFRVSMDGKIEVVTDKLDTPSQIAFDKNGDLIVADSGTNTIKKIKPSGEIELIAGVENQKGFRDGAAQNALFNAPVGVAVSGNKIYVADTYNDKIRVVENGNVTTLSGGAEGFSDGFGSDAKFDTPCGLAILRGGEIVVADAKNRRLRVVEQNGNVWTLTGDGKANLKDGLPEEAEFVQPTAVSVDIDGSIYIADGNAIRVIEKKNFPAVVTISNAKRGFADGDLQRSQFNRPSGLAVDERGNLFVADSDNQTIRVLTGENLGSEISSEQIEKLHYTPEEFRSLQPARWTYNPPDARRDIAGTLGEVRGEVSTSPEKRAWFHNGLDIAGSYGETARFIRAEKVLLPVATEDFGGLRERLRMPTLGYIHIRLGRDKDDNPFPDERFIFTWNPDIVARGDYFGKNGQMIGTRTEIKGKVRGVRIPRGAKFEAGEAIGTLNKKNHVHLIAGRAGAEMNALDALTFPNITDKLAPTIEKIYLADENWQPLETKDANQRIKLDGKTRIVVRAFDQMDGGASYRKLGVYRLGYQILREDNTPLNEMKWTISFAKMPDEDFVPLVYAPHSRAGYTPDTIFDYIVTNEVIGERGQENFFDAGSLEKGNYIVRAAASDFFGNKTEKDLSIEVVK
ncbi:MAG: hypothetical protein ACR2GD_12485 [Pyrinomonadaceae bacterium]